MNSIPQVRGQPCNLPLRRQRHALMMAPPRWARKNTESSRASASCILSWPILMGSPVEMGRCRNAFSRRKSLRQNAQHCGGAPVGWVERSDTHAVRGGGIARRNEFPRIASGLPTRTRSLGVERSEFQQPAHRWASQARSTHLRNALQPAPVTVTKCRCRWMPPVQMKKSPAQGGAESTKHLRHHGGQGMHTPCWPLWARSMSSRLATAYMA